jgi:hypothetical protein
MYGFRVVRTWVLEEDTATNTALSGASYIQFGSVVDDRERQVPMITGELKNKVDRVWDAFWSGGISNPLEVIE